MADFARRMARAADQAAAAGLTGILVAPGPDPSYLAGYAPVAITERLTLLVVQQHRDPAMVLPVLERPDAEHAPSAGTIELTDWTDGEDPYAVAAPLLEPEGRYAISDSAWALQLLGLQAALPGTRYVSMTSALPMLRGVKDADELERLAAAGAAADACFEALLEVRFAGRTENQVAADLAALLLAHGHSQVDFTVVGSGPNGANPHHEASDRTIEEGDMIVLDFGGLKDATDPTRAEPSTSASRPARSARCTRSSGAQQAGFKAVRPGATCPGIDRAARAVITDAGCGEQFIHRTGHGIGLTTHEPPYMVEGEPHPLEAGMCFSIEPGIYLGVRIEDIVTVTEDGGRRLNNTAREMQIVH